GWGEGPPPRISQAVAALGVASSSAGPAVLPQPLVSLRVATLEPLPDIPNWKTRSLIACVPDPIDSSSGHRFDALIDTIQRAVETQDYVLDRFYYPWPESKKQRKASPAARSTRGAGQEKLVEVMAANSPVKLTIKVKDLEERPQMPIHQRQPGLLL